jgi:hypothetical protein
MLEFYTSNQSFFVILGIATTLFAVTALVIAIINMLRISKIQKNITNLFAGKKGSDLEKIILQNNAKLVEFDKEIQELFNISNAINTQAHKSLHKVGIIRFNPFGERAGNQSFALALLNSKNDGLVMSSLHTREGTRLYTKQIKDAQPVESELTEEEKQAIQQAN